MNRAVAVVRDLRAGLLVGPGVVILAAVAGLEAGLVVARSPEYAAVGESVRFLVVEQAAGWLLLISAVLLFWFERGGRRGPGLAVVAAAWFVADWNSPAASPAAAFTAGLVLVGACPVVVAHVVLGWSGRDHRIPAGVGFVAAGYTSTVGLAGLVPALFRDPAAGGCNGCPADLLLVRDLPHVADLAERLGTWAGAVWAPGLAAIMAFRFIRLSRARRRATVGVVLPALAHLGVVGARYWISVEQGYLGSAPTDQRLRVAQAASLIAMAAGAGWPFVDRRLTRTRVARLVVVAGELSEPGGLDRSLGGVVGDRSLRVLYPVGERWVDAAGEPAEVVPGRARTPVTRDGAPIAVLEHRAGALDRDGLVEDVAGTAALVLDNARLQAERRARLVDLQASRARLVAAADEERRRLERDLHDGAQQVLVAASLSIRLAQLRTPTDAGPEAAAGLQGAQDEVTAALTELRDLARGLYPRELADEGLVAALEVYADGARFPVGLHCAVQGRLPVPVESAAFFVVACRLGRAGVGRASVSVSLREDLVVVVVEDDGPGQDLEQIIDRVAAVAGTVSAEPVPGAGTRVRAELPCVW